MSVWSDLANPAVHRPETTDRLALLYPSLS